MISMQLSKFELEKSVASIVASQLYLEQTAAQLMSLHAALAKQRLELENKYQQLEIIDHFIESRLESVDSLVRLNLRGKVVVVEKKYLLSLGLSYFTVMLCSQPRDVDSGYFIDRPFDGFDRIADCLQGGDLSLNLLDPFEMDCIQSNLIYFKLPKHYSRRSYQHSAVIKHEHMSARHLILKDNRLLTIFDLEMKVWNLSTLACDMILSLPEEEDSVYNCLELESGRICTGSCSGAIRFWDLCTGSCVMEILEVGPDIVNFFELDKQRICCCCVSQLKVWDVTNGECLTSINIDDSWADILKINDSLVYVITHSDEISVWDINSWECLKAREVEYGIIFGDKKIVLMNGNLLVFTLLADGVGTYMKIWDRCSLDCLQTIVLEHDVSQMIEIYCGTVSLSFVNSRKIQIFDVEEGKLLKSLVCTSGSISYFSKLKDGRMLAVGDRLTIWNVDTWECECVLEPSVDGHFTSALQISDGRIVSFSYDPSAFNMWTIQ